MKRRTFLSAAAGLAASPALLRRAFAAEPTDRVTALFDAYRRARRRGRPLLVILIPKERSEFGIVGGAWGEYINHGAEPQLAPLAIFEPACATAEDLARLAPQAAVEADTRFVVLGTESVPASATGYRVELASGPGGRGRGAHEAKVNEAIDARIAALAEQVAAAARDRADAFAAPASPTQRREPERVDVEAFPGWSWQLATHHDPAARLTERLADVARARFRDEPIPGSRWARSAGCGVTVEGADDNVAIGCGMGHTPRRSQRFLHFYEKGR